MKPEEIARFPPGCLDDWTPGQGIYWRSRYSANASDLTKQREGRKLLGPRENRASTPLCGMRFVTRSRVRPVFLHITFRCGDRD